jgi:hypothetical protein
MIVQLLRSLQRIIKEYLSQAVGKLMSYSGSLYLALAFIILHL